jgi:hypothetical protein
VFICFLSLLGFGSLGLGDLEGLSRSRFWKCNPLSYRPRHQDFQILARAIVVVETANSPATLQYNAPFIAANVIKSASLRSSTGAF